MSTEVKDWHCPMCGGIHNTCADMEYRISHLEAALRPFASCWHKSLVDPVGAFVPGHQLNPIQFVREQDLLGAYRTLGPHRAGDYDDMSQATDRAIDQHVSADEHVPGGLEVRRAIDSLQKELADMTNAIGRLKERLQPVLSISSPEEEETLVKTPVWDTPLAQDIAAQAALAYELGRDIDLLIHQLQV